MEYQPLPDRNDVVENDTVAEPEVPPQDVRPEDTEEAQQRRRRLRIWVVVPAIVVAASALTGIVVGASINMPEVETLETFVPRLVTQLYDRNDQVFQVYSRENRVLLEEGDIPEVLQNAVLAAEDTNFFHHGGIDLQGIARAAWTNLREKRFAQGASTITMQLTRELFLSREKSFKRKVEEAFLAVQVEKKYSKQQILTMYCNMVNLAHGNYGMEAAARDYFNKSVGQLTTAEAATLAGIPQRPSYYSIRHNPEAVKKRRNTVLRRMAEEGFISEEEAEQAIAEPLLVAARRREQEVGPYFAEEVRRFLSTTYGTTALYDRGLQVHTTLDRSIQLAADAALREGLSELDHRKGWRGATQHLEGDDLESRSLPSWIGQEVIPGQWYEGIVLASDGQRALVKIDQQTFELSPKGIQWTRRSRPEEVLRRGDVAWFRLQLPEKEGESEPLLVLEQEPVLEGAVLVIESGNGAVRALVGGWNYERNEFSRATQAERQVGSAFKPFVYGAALESGFTSADTLFDGPAVFLGADAQYSYSPRNYYREYNGIITLRRALELSINVVAVKLLDLVGVEQVIDLARRCGVTSELPPYPSLALGSADLRPIELAAAYATLANHGVYIEPYFIEKVASREGRVMEEHLPSAQKAMEPEIAYLLTRMLKGVVERGTAAAQLRGIDLDMAGKTGTTNDYTDAWFVGFTPQYTVLTWVGYDKKRSIGRGMTGAQAALPIWKRVIERGLEDGWLTAGERFDEPPGVVTVDVDYATGLRAAPGANRVIKEYFVEGTEPQQRFDPRWSRIMELPWYQQVPFYLPKEGERMPGQIRDWTVVHNGNEE